MAKKTNETETNGLGAKIKALFTPKVILILLAVLLVIIGVIIGVVQFNRWRNDGERYARNLSEQIGTVMETAQKEAHVEMKTTSEYACINLAAEGYNGLYESGKTVQVSGVTIPQWLILTRTSGGNLTEVAYYDYRQLKKYGNGVKTSAHVATDGVTTGMATETVEEYVGFAPLCTLYTSATDMSEHYKYYYKDKNTGDTVSYILTVNYKDGKVVSVSEDENYFILSVLTLD